MSATAATELELTRRRGARPRRAAEPVLAPWVRSQALNATRHAAHLRPFSRGEFGSGPEAPSEGHLRAANALIVRLRSQLLASNEPLRRAARRASAHPSSAELERLLALKE